MQKFEKFSEKYLKISSSPPYSYLIHFNQNKSPPTSPPNPLILLFSSQY